MADESSLPSWVFIIIGIGGSFLLLIVVWIVCKCRQRHQIDYTALDEEQSLLQKWEDEKRVKKNNERDAVLLHCYFYLKNSSKYSFINNLNDIGSRSDKHWFLVQDSRSRSQNLLSMTQWSQQCVLPCTTQTKRTLSELFNLLSLHPYIFPVQSVDLMSEQRMVVLIQPFIEAGSLKDMIYCSHSKSAWLDKYELKGKHLSETKIKNYGRQILEALIFLQRKGLPQCEHLHSGNVFIVHGVCKVSGYETSLFGYKSRLEHIIKSLTKHNEDSFEIISFGHLLFEMATGTELKVAEPDLENLSKCRSEQVIEVLKAIFHKDNGSYPSLVEIASHPFFKYADVSHVKTIKKDKIKIGSSIKSLFKLYGRDGETSQSRRRKRERKKSRGESMTESKRARTRSRSKSIKKSSAVNAPESVVVFKQDPAPPIPPPPLFGAPPPPPPPTTNVPTPQVRFEGPPASPARSSLLADIRKGSALKKTKVNDRSAPKI